jgi:hypothetical protein
MPKAKVMGKDDAMEERIIENPVLVEQKKIEEIKRLPREEQAKRLQKLLDDKTTAFALNIGNVTLQYDHAKTMLAQTHTANVNKILGQFKETIDWINKQNEKKAQEESEAQKEYVAQKIRELKEVKEKQDGKTETNGSCGSDKPAGA